MGGGGGERRQGIDRTAVRGRRRDGDKRKAGRGAAWMINSRKCLKLWSAHPCCCFVAALPCVPPSLSHLCNSISVLQWALVDLFRRSTKWLAKSPSFFPSLSLLLQPTQACRWHTLPFIIPSLINPSLRRCCRSVFIPPRRHGAREPTPQLKATQTTYSEERRNDAGKYMVCHVTSLPNIC